MLIDYPLLLRGVRSTDPDAAPRVGEMVRKARSLGMVHAARAYGAWYDVDEASGAFSAGVDPVFVPPAGAGSAPTTSALVADGLSLMRSGQVDVLALSGDDRLLPLISAARAEGIPVTLIAHSCAADGPCLKLVDSADPAAAYARSITRGERYRRSPSASGG